VVPPVSSPTFTSGVTISTVLPRLDRKSATPKPAWVLTASYTSTFLPGSTLPDRMSQLLTATPSSTPQSGTWLV
jgi:hypothetical protein